MSHQNRPPKSQGNKNRPQPAKPTAHQKRLKFPIKAIPFKPIPIKPLLESLLDFILPPICLNCHSALLTADQLCPECWQNINFISSPFCQINGTPLPFDIGVGALSTHAIANPPEYAHARACAHYDGTMRELIHKLKYQDRHELTTLMARWLNQTGTELISQSELIIPIPLHPWRLWQRRFNQATLLAKKLAIQTGLPVDLQSLQRPKKTKTQVGLSQKQRKSNLEGAFKIHNNHIEMISNRTILLIDDVITTGATVNAAAKTLKRAGATNVNVLSLARVISNSPQNP